MSHRLRTDPPMASPPPGRKTLPGGWWLHDFEPGTTLLSRELTRQLRARRGYTNQDERRQRELRAYARWCWEIMPECLPEGGHA